MNTAFKSTCLVALLALTAPLDAQQAALLPAGVAPFVTVNSPVVALTHVRVVDGTGAAARHDQTVVINGDRIASIGSFDTTTIPPEARVLDLSDHTVLPGL